MTIPYNFNPTILREYDVRGVVGKTLSATDAFYVGLSFGSMVARGGGTKVGFCYDGRHSSPEFATQLSQGLQACGLLVENYGLGPTPMAYFAMYHRNLDACVVITGSHNPPDYNGIKLTRKQGPFYGAQIQNLGTIASKGDYALAQGGSEITVDIYDAYLDRLVADLNLQGQHLNLVWDAGNGVAGHILERLVSRIPQCTHSLLFADVDGNFPNHHPDPSVEKNLGDLKNIMRHKQADLGLAFDGDADRVGAVDELCQTIPADQLSALYACEITGRVPNAKIVYDVKCSQAVFDTTRKVGAEVEMWKTGHSLMKARMLETGALLGGELSGHIFFKDGFYGHDDGLYAAIRLINLVAAAKANGQPASSLCKIFAKTFSTPEWRVDVVEEKKFGHVENIKQRIKAQAANDSTMNVNDIDGIRVTTPQGWWLLRASNTQNVLVLRAESFTAEGLATLQAQANAALIAEGLSTQESAH